MRGKTIYLSRFKTTFSCIDRDNVYTTIYVHIHLSFPYIKHELAVQITACALEQILNLYIRTLCSISCFGGLERLPIRTEDQLYSPRIREVETSDLIVCGDCGNRIKLKIELQIADTLSDNHCCKGRDFRIQVKWRVC